MTKLKADLLCAVTTVRSPELFLGPHPVSVIWIIFQIDRKDLMHRKLSPDRGWNDASWWQWDCCAGSAVLVVHGPNVLQASLLAEPHSAAHSVPHMHVKQAVIQFVLRFWHQVKTRSFPGIGTEAVSTSFQRWAPKVRSTLRVWLCISCWSGVCQTWIFASSRRVCSDALILEYHLIVQYGTV